MDDLIEIALSIGGSAGALIVAGIAVVGLGLILHVSTGRTRSILVYFAYPLLMATVVGTLVSGRDFSMGQDNHKVTNPILSVANWGATLFFLIGVTERFVQATFHKSPNTKRPVGLMIVWPLTWITMVGLPMFFGAIPKINHDFSYMLFIGYALLLCDPEDAERSIKATRDAIFIFLVLSAITLVFKRELTVDVQYKAGLIPGLPRYAGLAPGAVSMGTTCLVGILCQWLYPHKSRGMNIWAWAFLLASFLIAQVKTTWICFIFCWVAIMWVRHGYKINQNIRQGRNIGTTLTALLAASVAIIATVAFTLFGNVDDKLSRLEASKEGGELMSFTGRDEIWRVALQEWERNPWVGYGPHLFDDEYRASINMPFATHGHNQLVDTLARAGMVGAFEMILFTLTFGYVAFKNAKRSRGLSVALFALVIVRSISEVPIHLWGYGTESFSLFFILLISIRPVRETQEVVELAPVEAEQEPTYYSYPAHGVTPGGFQGGFAGAGGPFQQQGPIEPSFGDPAPSLGRGQL